MCASPYISLFVRSCLHGLDIHLSCSSRDFLLKMSEVITKDVKRFTASLQIYFKCFTPHIFAEMLVMVVKLK
jgi:hypothetical protein